MNRNAGFMVMAIASGAFKGGFVDQLSSNRRIKSDKKSEPFKKHCKVCDRKFSGRGRVCPECFNK